MKEKASFILVLVGSVLQLFSFVFIPIFGWGFFGWYCCGPEAGEHHGMMMPMWGYLTPYWLILGLVIIGISFLAVFLIASEKEDSVRAGAILAIVISIIAFPTMWGFIAGSILMLIGGILALTEKGS